MPAYNATRFIRQAIDSVLAQTLADLELIVVDDASTDDTATVVERIVDARIRLIRNRCNSGPAYSRNAGIAAARGEWIALIDTDDWFTPDRLEAMLVEARLHDADAVADDLFIVDNGTRRARSTLLLEAACATPDRSFLCAVALVSHEIGALKPLFRRRLFAERGHRYDVRVRYGEDYLLYLGWLVDDVRLLVLREPRYFLRRGDTGSLTTRRLAMAAAAVALNRRLLADDRIAARPGLKQALARRMEKARDLLVFYEVLCPLRERRYADAALALSRAPQFIFVALRRLPAIVGLRLGRLAFRWRRPFMSPFLANAPGARQDLQ
jgi:succinoglycan biosynthesis protein ExoO